MHLRHISFFITPSVCIYKKSVMGLCFILLWLLMYQEQLVNLIKKVALYAQYSYMVIAIRNSILQDAPVSDEIYVKVYLWGIIFL